METPGPPYNLVHLPLLFSHIWEAGQARLESEPTEATIQKLAGLKADLDYLPYALAAAFAAVDLLGSLLRDLAANPPAHAQHAPTAAQILGSSETEPLAFAVDAFLDAARRAQNSVIPYLTRALRVSLPASVAQLANELRSGSRQLPDPIPEIILSYWQTSGGRLKDYRDLAQHHALVSSEARLAPHDGGQWSVYLALPNNPAARSPAKLRYRDPTVLAYPYCRETLLLLFQFLYEVTYVLCRRLGPRQTCSLIIMPRAPLDGGGFLSHWAPLPEDLPEALIAVRHSFRDECVRAYGALEDLALDVPPN